MGDAEEMRAEATGGQVSPRSTCGSQETPGLPLNEVRNVELPELRKDVTCPGRGSLRTLLKVNSERKWGDCQNGTEVTRPRWRWLGAGWVQGQC